MKRLALFDIDETLIYTDGAGRRAIGRALMEKFQVDASKLSVSMSGKTDPQILREMLELAKRPPDAENDAMLEREMYELYIELLEEELKKEGRYVIHKGIPELLHLLDEHNYVQMGLLTGNIERGAQLKLARFDLWKFFPIGAYGSDSANRMDLPAIATRRAEEHYGIKFAPHEVAVIGDSIYDVMCAKHFGAVSIAVNTGVTTREALLEQKPDYLFDSLEDINAVLEAILK